MTSYSHLVSKFCRQAICVPVETVTISNVKTKQFINIRNLVVSLTFSEFNMLSTLDNYSLLRCKINLYCLVIKEN